jgi:hypothetical protein
MTDGSFASVSQWVISIFSLLVTVGFGIYAISVSRKQTAQLRANIEQTGDILESTKTLSENLTTRHIGDFPNFLDDILRCLSEAHTKVLIACDVPGYAMLTDRKFFIAYESILKQKTLDNVRIQLIVQHSKQRRWLNDNQFAAQKRDWEGTLRADRNFAERLRIFQHQESVEIKCLTELEECLERAHERILTSAGLAEARFTYDGLMPLYCWIVDGRAAIFTMPAPNVTEHGFYTRDEGLIRALESIWERYCHDSNCQPLA